MNDSEKMALRQIQDENFRLRVELDHERKCIDAAALLLKQVPSLVMRAKEPIPHELASLLDDALKVLNEPAPKAT